MKQTKPDRSSPDRQGIGVQKERSLHAALKQWYARPGDQLEARVDGYIVDILRGEDVIEVQTRNLAALRVKLRALLEHRRVRLVYPIAQEKWIVRTSARGARVLGRRKSPKAGRLADLFYELVSIPDLIDHPNLVFEIALIQEEEVRRADGRGSWWRKRQSIHDRRLLGVLETVVFKEPADFLRFLPADLVAPFSNASLAESMSCSVDAARRVTYCLKKMGAIREIGKRGNALVFELAPRPTRREAGEG